MSASEIRVGIWGMGKLPPPSYPQLSVVCAWCEKDLGKRPCVPAMSGKVSHGICPECRDREFPGLIREVGLEHFTQAVRMTVGRGN